MKKQLNEEYPLADEESEIRKMVALVEAIHHPQHDGSVRRAQHAKDTGCVKAQLIVEPDLAPEYRFGVFREPRTYDDVIIRFSRGSEWVESDSKKTMRGMAIKIPHVDGERAIVGDGESSQDFLMVDSPSFLFATIKDYATFFALRLSKKSDPKALLAFFPSYPRQALRTIIVKVFYKVKDSLIRQYWSQSPYRLGPRAVKFSAKSQEANSKAAPDRNPQDAENFLFRRMADHLKENDAAFDFMVQFQEDADRMPIEDASVEWDEARSPFRKVATIRIPAQDLDSPEMEEFRASCEGLSFSPWHALADHRPLGGLNRLRRVAYEASLGRRLQKPS